MTTRAAWAQPMFRTYPFSLGVASGDPWPDERRAVDAAGARAVRRRRHADGERRSVVAGRHRSRIPHRSFETGPRLRGRSLVTASTSRPMAWHPAANTSIASAAAARPARLGGRKRRRRPARRSIGCASACAAAATTRPATSPPTAVLAEEQFDFVFHTGDYIYEGRGDANRNPEQRARCISARRSTRWSTIETATRNTNPIRI